MRKHKNQRFGEEIIMTMLLQTLQDNTDPFKTETMLEEEVASG
jgi:hypothetical protein